MVLALLNTQNSFCFYLFVFFFFLLKKIEAYAHDVVDVETLVPAERLKALLSGRAGVPVATVAEASAPPNDDGLSLGLVAGAVAGIVALVVFVVVLVVLVVRRRRRMSSKALVNTVTPMFVNPVYTKAAPRKANELYDTSDSLRLDERVIAHHQPNVLYEPGVTEPADGHYYSTVELKAKRTGEKPTGEKPPSAMVLRGADSSSLGTEAAGAVRMLRMEDVAETSTDDAANSPVAGSSANDLPGVLLSSGQVYRNLEASGAADGPVAYENVDVSGAKQRSYENVSIVWSGLISECLRECPAFHTDATRSDAELLLRDAAFGAYLLRSRTSSTDVVLSFRAVMGVAHVVIQRIASGELTCNDRLTGCASGVAALLGFLSQPNAILPEPLTTPIVLRRPATTSSSSSTS